MGNQVGDQPRVQRRKGGPRYQAIGLAVSEDGLNFKNFNRYLTEYGGVPCLITEPNGTIIASYQYFDPVGEFITLSDNSIIRANTHGMAISKSRDGGETWSQYTKIRLRGFKEKIRGPPCDPAIALLEDGSTRLYFTCGLENRSPCTLSAKSRDGEVFDIEEGIRFIDEGKMVLDPSIIRIKNIWHYFAPVQSRPDSLPLFKSYHATSIDGLNFKREPDIEGEGMRFLGNPCIVEGGYRFYTTHNGVSSVFSKDGYNWIQESGTRLSGPDVVGDAGVTRLKDGKYLMAYTTNAIREDPFERLLR